MHQGSSAAIGARTLGRKALDVSSYPLVSVIIPAYNAEVFIARTLVCVLNQTYRNLEVIVVDDGSTDRTADIVRRLASEDARIVLYQQKNSGVAAARNYGIQNASGEFIAPLDADDLWHKTNVEKQVRLLFLADSKVGMAYAWTASIDEADCFTGHMMTAPYYGNVYSALLYENIVGSGSACLIRRSCLEAVGSYNSDLLAQDAQGCEDWDLYLRIAKRYQVGVVPEVLVGYRRAASSMSTYSDKMERSRQLVFANIKSQFPLVHQKVDRWAASLNDRYACRTAFKAGQISLAWQSLRRAIATDPIMSLATYDTWVLWLLLAKRSLSSTSASDRVSAREQADLRQIDLRQPNPTRELEARSVEERPEQRQFQDKEQSSSKTLKSALLLKSRLRMWISPLFPQMIIHRLRLWWITAKLCAGRPAPKVLSAFTGHRTRLAYRRRSRQGKYSYLTYASEECL